MTIMPVAPARGSPPHPGGRPGPGDRGIRDTRTGIFDTRRRTVPPAGTWMGLTGGDSVENRRVGIAHRSEAVAGGQCPPYVDSNERAGVGRLTHGEHSTRSRERQESRPGGGDL